MDENQLNCSPSSHQSNGSSLNSSSSCSYTILKSPGYRIELESYGDRWKATVYDNCFPDLTRSYSASVAFEKGYCLENFITMSPSYQSRHIHFLSIDKDSPMVYIGSLGLKGGGCGCDLPTWRCVCGFICPDDCCEHCCGHKAEHESCRLVIQKQQEIWSAQARYNCLSKSQEASAQWKKEEQSRQYAEAVRELRVSQEGLGSKLEELGSKLEGLGSKLEGLISELESALRHAERILSGNE
ncbi:hypothetical protein AVEN_107635-1 [Araneus ventricosus]|uniref:Uncharacterized protein n=1 Tax=Araneus ventricosus TaxID=182803 RepID=A0A4Y2RGU9_ARAVE|nr:hypothetical protein AVEN_107635-1 [Araneus ventricosus]